MRKLPVVVVMGLLSLALLAGVAYQALMRAAAPLHKVSIAVPLQLSGGAFFIAQQQQLFARNGIDAQLREFRLGKDALESMLAGKADLAIVADVPAMLAIARGNDFVIAAVVFSSRTAAALLVRADHGIGAVADLKGRSVVTVGGTNVEYLLDKILARHHVDRASIALSTRAPAAMTQAFLRGEVDAITAWQPELAQLQHELGAKARALHEPDMFVYRFVLAGKRDFIARHPALLRSVLRTLDASAESMRREPAAAIGTLGAKLGLEPAALARFFDAGDYGPVLDQSLLVALDDQTRWAMERSLIPAGPIPNYLDFIDAAALRAVRPGADRMIDTAPAR